MKVLAVGDIHTKTWIIKAVAKLVDKYDAVVFVGDYADDFGVEGPQSIKTWQALKKLQDKYPEKVNLVLGNHDYIYVNKTPTLQTGFNPITQLLINDPDNKELRDWLHDLPIWIEVDSVTYSHAGLTEYFTDDDELWQDDSPLWVRPNTGRHYKKMPQVFGHTPSETCWEVEPYVWCIDTFSTYPDGRQFGDNTALEVVNGKQFKKVEIKNGQSNNSTNRKSV